MSILVHFTHFTLFCYTLFFLWGLQVISHSRKACYTFFSRSARSCFSLTFRCQITVVICVCYVCMRVWACVCVFVYVCVVWSVFLFFLSVKRVLSVASGSSTGASSASHTTVDFENRFDFANSARRNDAAAAVAEAATAAASAGRDISA